MGTEKWKLTLLGKPLKKGALKTLKATQNSSLDNFIEMRLKMLENFSSPILKKKTDIVHPPSTI